VRRLFRFPGGFIEVRSDEPEPRVLRWSETDAVTLVFNDADESYNGLSACTLGSGSRVSITPPYDKPARCQLAREAERVLAPAIVPSLIGVYESGEPVTFGTWRIDQAGVTEDAGTPRAAFVPWGDVHDVTLASESYRGRIDPASLVTLTPGPGTRRRGPRLSLSGIPNGIFLPHLLGHIASRNGLPLHKAVVEPGKGG
jgi:hypothetical protein